MSFPATMQAVQAPGVAGDFASANPRWNVLAGEGAIVAGDSLYVGRFAWVDPAVLVAQSKGKGAPAGLIGRLQQGLITTWLAESTMQIQQGTPVTVFNGGDFLVKNDGSGTAVTGMKAFANFADGKIQFAAAGSSISSGSATGSVAASTFSVTATLTDSILNVSAVGSGAVRNGATISGTGIPTGATIVRQLGGTTNGVGTYEVSIPGVAASTTVSGTYGTFTAASALTGSFAVGDVLSGSGVDNGTTITDYITGTGGLGTYAVSSNTVVTSTTISATAAYETKWYAASNGYASELVAITSHANG